MELIILAVIIFAVYKTVRARRKNAREAEESRKKFAELNKLSPGRSGQHRPGAYIETRQAKRPCGCWRKRLPLIQTTGTWTF